MQDLRARIAYLRGLAQSRRLSEPEQNELLIRELLDVMDALAGEVEQLKERLGGPSSYVRRCDNNDLPATLRNSAGNTISCPSCRQRLAIGRELLDLDTFEVTCPECSLILQVM